MVFRDDMYQAKGVLFWTSARRCHEFIRDWRLRCPMLEGDSCPPSQCRNRRIRCDAESCAWHHSSRWPRTAARSAEARKDKENSGTCFRSSGIWFAWRGHWFFQVGDFILLQDSGAGIWLASTFSRQDHSWQELFESDSGVHQEKSGKLGSGHVVLWVSSETWQCHVSTSRILDGSSSNIEIDLIF